MGIHLEYKINIPVIHQRFNDRVNGVHEFIFGVGIRFRVRDNGIGMSPEFLPHLYDPFSQERSEENITENLMDARILLVEDNEINIYVAQLILEKAGCVVEIANGTYHCHDSGCF